MSRDHHADAPLRRRARVPCLALGCPVAAHRARARSLGGRSTCRGDRPRHAAISLLVGSPALFPGCSRKRGPPSRRRVRSGERACRRCQRYLRNSASRSLLCLSPRPRSLSAIFLGPPPRALRRFFCRQPALRSVLPESKSCFPQAAVLPAQYTLRSSFLSPL